MNWTYFFYKFIDISIFYAWSRSASFLFSYNNYLLGEMLEYIFLIWFNFCDHVLESIWFNFTFFYDTSTDVLISFFWILPPFLNSNSSLNGYYNCRFLRDFVSFHTSNFAFYLFRTRDFYGLLFFSSSISLMTSLVGRPLKRFLSSAFNCKSWSGFFKYSSKFS